MNGPVSYFSTELAAVLEDLGVSRALFAERIGLASSSLHNLVHAKARPDAEALETLCIGLDQPQRARLVIAHLRDEIPPSATDLVRIVSLVGRTHEAPPDEPKARLPKSVRADFDYLERMAVKHPEVVASIQSTVRILRDVSPPKLPTTKEVSDSLKKGSVTYDRGEE